MTLTQDLVRRLASPGLPIQERRRSLNRFARDLGWQPSDQVDEYATRDFAPAHLVVEHGFENSAVISFLSRPFTRLGRGERRELFSLSYNNLVDWHFSFDESMATLVFNRTDPVTVVDTIELSSVEVERLRSEMFDELAGRRPSPNVPALDDALINTISHWKRLLVAELEDRRVSNEALSSLFNAVIFARAVEDHAVRAGQADREVQRLLSVVWDRPQLSLREVIERSLALGLSREPPAYLFDPDALAVFDALSGSTIEGLLRDFYDNRYSSLYRYDFAVMSKHALSRIYEHYVSILSQADSPQASLFPAVPDEILQHGSGSVYTPEFIARFFARVLKDNLPPNQFRQLRAIDPACGSGIFLRTLVEVECDPFLEFPGDVREQVNRAFGIDIDANAAQAARLSMALLYLVLTDGELPATLPISASDALTWFHDNADEEGQFDAVIANPPFVPTEKQSEETRDRIREFLGPLGVGRTDTAHVFLELGLRLLRPGGFGLFVLPHSFLISESAAPLRRHLREEAQITYVVDLSGVPVFEHVEAYVILLIFQKKAAFTQPVSARLVRVRELVGTALRDALQGHRVETSYYSVDEVPQSFFDTPDWVLAAPSEAALRKRLERGVQLGDSFDVRQGFVSGADEIFIIQRSAVPPGEEALFVPYLPDREMRSYSTPGQVEEVFFYPYLDGQLVDEGILRSDFPRTFALLSTSRDSLEERAAVRKGTLAWWRPERPRPPHRMLRPKIMTPHLAIVPRFCLDPEGQYAVSRSPIILNRTDLDANLDLLTFLLGILNSSPCFWHVTHTSHKYQSGYSMLEPKTLKRTPIPDVRSIDPSALRRFIGMVEDRRIGRGNARELEEKIDRRAADFYGLDRREREFLGLKD